MSHSSGTIASVTDAARSQIALLRVQRAFGDEAATVEPMIVVNAREGLARLRTMAGEDRTARLSDAAAFAAALDRRDLTRVREHPFLLVNVRRRLIALAFGPKEPPEQIRMLAHIVRLEAGSAVEIPGDDDTQPSWLLFEAEIDDP
jgi:hypothetical protein